MADLTGKFETGVHGNNILTTDAGSDTAWNVLVANNATVVYDNTSAALAEGSLAGKFSTGGTPGQGMLQWTTAFPDGGTDHYGRVYFYATTFASLVNTVTVGVEVRDSAAARAAQIMFGSDGKIRLRNASAVVVATSATVLSDATLYRIEYRVIHSDTAGQIIARLYAGHSTTLIEEISASSVDTNADAGQSRIGMFGTVANLGPFWFDGVVANATTWPGPVVGNSAPVNTVAPVVSGTELVGETLSCTEGTWTGTPTPTYTYQWQVSDDGVGGWSNIGGATSNSYVLQSAEEGKYVRCAVTATNLVDSVTANSNVTGAISGEGPPPPPDPPSADKGAPVTDFFIAGGLF